VLRLQTFPSEFASKTSTASKTKFLESGSKKKSVTFNLSGVDDIVGMRIVTLYDRDMAGALDFVFKIIDAGKNGLFPGQTRWDAIRQFRIYKPWISARRQSIRKARTANPGLHSGRHQ